MNESAAGRGPLARVFLLLVAAFVLIKVLVAVFSDELLRHASVAVVLFVLPLLHSGKSSFLFFKPDLMRQPKNYWGIIFCFLYILIPLCIVGLFYPQDWFRITLDIRNWFLSPAGFSAILIAPLAEEFFFRGWLLNFQLRRGLQESQSRLAVRRLSSYFWLCYFNALCFWVLHIPVQADFFAQWWEALRHGAIPVSPGPFFLGFCAAALTLFTGTPLAAIVFHGLANALGPLWWPVLSQFGVRSYFYQ